MTEPSEAAMREARETCISFLGPNSAYLESGVRQVARALDRHAAQFQKDIEQHVAVGVELTRENERLKEAVAAQREKDAQIAENYYDGALRRCSQEIAASIRSTP